jgi:hypothetical protein
MAKQTLKEALGADLQSVPTSTDSRFARAEAYFATPKPPTHQSRPDTTRAKVRRDGFTMPVSDYALIAHIQAASLQAGLSVTKSEVLRAGLQVLSQLPPAELARVLRGLEKVKTGRTAKGD